MSLIVGCPCCKKLLYIPKTQLYLSGIGIVKSVTQQSSNNFVMYCDVETVQLGTCIELPTLSINVTVITTILVIGNLVL